MLEDYYAILGVEPTADQDAIGQAYRKRAAECHPDHGGSHEQMILVNKAWEILSNAEARARYDLVRSGTASAAVKTAVADDIDAAQRHAAEYPRDWSSFEQWIDSVAGDFARAQYSTSPGPGPGPGKLLPWPTAENSDSAVGFIVIGGVLGLVLPWGYLIWRMYPHSWQYLSVLLFPRYSGHFVVQFYLMWYFVLFVLPIFAGAWVGRYLHPWVGRVVKELSQKTLERGTSTRPKAETKLVVRCPSCGRKLSLPKTSSILTVTCPACRNSFDLPASVV